MATDGVRTSLLTGGFASSKVMSGSETAQTLSSNGNVMWQPPEIPGPGWQGNLFTGLFGVNADSSLVYSHEGYPEEAAGGIPRNDSYMSAILSGASKMSSRARSDISSETLHRKPTDIRACDNCRKAKVRCGGERATKYCQGHVTLRYRPAVTMVNSTVIREEKAKKGRKCQWCSRRGLPCEDFVPCTPCARKSVECVIPTRAPPGSNRGKRASRARPKVTPALPPDSLPGSLDSPDPSPSGQAPTTFSEKGAHNTQASPSAQPEGQQQQIALPSYRADQLELDLQPSETYAEGNHYFSSMGREVTRFNNPLSYCETEMVSILLGSQPPVRQGQPSDQRRVHVDSIEPWLLEYHPPRTGGQLRGERPCEKQAYEPPLYVQHSTDITYNTTGEIPIPRDIFSHSSFQ